MSNQPHESTGWGGVFALLAVLITLILASAALGQQAASCRVFNQLGNFSNIGSGTLISKTADGREGLVLTCWHTFREGQGSIVVTFPGGKRHGARIVAANQQADLAALVIANPATEPVRIASSIKTGEALTACGFGEVGQYRCMRGLALRSINESGQTSVLLSSDVRQGDSGGGVFNQRGELVAVVWGHRDGVTYASAGPQLTQFVAQWPGVQGRCFGGNCPQPHLQQPGRMVPASPQPIPQSPDSTGLNSLRDDIAKLRESLNQQQQLLEQQGSNSYVTPEALEQRDANLLDKLRGGVSPGGKLGNKAGWALMGALGLSGPAGLAVVAAGTVGGWWLGRRVRRRVVGRRQRRFRQREPG